MYPPPLFKSDDLEEALAIAESVRFANVFFVGEDGNPAVVFLPFIVERGSGQGFLLAHALRSNPLRRLTAEGPLTARLVFNAADGYLSPSVYEEKARSGKVVPTWNYVASQFLVEMEAAPDDSLNDLLARQVEAFEADVGSDWKLEDAPEDYRDGLRKMIFGLRCRILEARAHRKLSQNRPGEMPNIRAWFERREEAVKGLAAWIPGEP